MCLWLVGTSSIASWTQVVLIWLCPMPIWKKWSNQICSIVTRWKRMNWFPRADTPQLAAYDKRTPGLFKTKFTGDRMIAWCNKTYFRFGAEETFSCKGVNRKTNQITKNKYTDVLLTKQSGCGTNRGFRSIDNKLYTYLQQRDVFSYFYPKRKILADAVSTAPLEIWGERHANL